MFFTTFVSSDRDIAECAATAGIKEVLLGPELLCRESKLTKDETMRLAHLARESDLSPVLVWDILMPETTLNELVTDLASWNLSIFDAVRVQDVGALQWLVEARPESAIQFIAETGNANMAGLRRWIAAIGAQLERLILSSQLPETQLMEYVEALDVPCEILGAGPILLFYSPRPLLTPKIEMTEGADAWLYAVSSSSESHHREFPTIENRHGTFMYLNKDLFVLDKLASLQTAGLQAVRIDLRQISEAPRSADGIADLVAAVESGVISAKQHWQKSAFAPFFRSNNTTKQFKKLKPQIHELRDERCVARVLMGRKPYQMILWALRDFDSADTFTLALPDGTEIDCGDLQFRDMHGQILRSCKEDQLLITGWVKKCCTGALLLGQAA